MGKNIGSCEICGAELQRDTGYTLKISLFSNDDWYNTVDVCKIHFDQLVKGNSIEQEETKE